MNPTYIQLFIQLSLAIMAVRILCMLLFTGKLTHNVVTGKIRVIGLFWE